MWEPVVLPWWMVGVGIVAAMCGAILAMTGWGQRQSRMMDVLGQWIIGIGLACAGLVLGVNMLVYVANGLGTIMQQSFASAAQPTFPQD